MTYLARPQPPSPPNPTHAPVNLQPNPLKPATIDVRINARNGSRPQAAGSVALLYLHLQTLGPQRTRLDSATAHLLQTHHTLPPSFDLELVDDFDVAILRQKIRWEERSEVARRRQGRRQEIVAEYTHG